MPLLCPPTTLHVHFQVLFILMVVIAAMALLALPFVE